MLVTPTLYGPDGRALAPSIVGLAKKSTTNPSAEDGAIRSAVQMCRGIDVPLPVIFGRRIIGYVEGKRAPDPRVTFRRVPEKQWCGFATYDQLIQALTAGQRLPCFFTKTATTAPVANNWYDLWPVGGNPQAGAFGGAASTAVQFLDTTAGALYTGGNVSTQTKHILSMAGVSSGGTPMLMLYDRVLTYEANIFNNTVNKTMTNTLPALRYVSAGQSGMKIMCTVQTLNGATAANLTQLRYCVDNATECLTKRGWMTQDQLRNDDQILAFDPVSEKTRWEKPLEVFRDHKYDDMMTLLGGDEWSALVTDDHRWPVRMRTRNGTKGKIVVKRTCDLGREHFLMRAAPFADAPKEATVSDAFVKLVAWYVAEGSRAGKYCASLTQSITENPLYVEDIRNTLRDLNAQPSTQKRGLQAKGKGVGRGAKARPGLWVSEALDKRSDVICFVLSGTGTDKLFAAAPGKDKVPTPEFITALTDTQLRLFVETMMKGDGTPEIRVFYQHQKARMDAYTMAAVLAGYAPSLDKTWTTCSLVGQRGKKKDPEARIHIGGMTRTQLHYTGTIWCPVTKSGHWIARRRGKVFITGNTNQAGTTLQSMPTGTTVTFIPSATAPTATLGARVIAPSTSGATLPWGPFLPLAVGDSGAQLINDFTTTSANTGTFTFTLARPLFIVPIGTAGVISQLDGIYQVASLERIFDGGCMVFILYFPAATATTFSGTLDVGWN
jgi:hypothetical protein